MYRVHSMFSVAALAGVLALLLADSAGPQCRSINYDQNFTIASSCGAVTETIRVTATDVDAVEATIEHVSGEAFVTSGRLVGSCRNDDDPVEYDLLTVDLAPSASGSGDPMTYCNINLETLAADCYVTSGGASGCTVTVTAL